MEKIDARKHDPKTQYENRKQIIRFRKQRTPNKVVAEGLGITARHASKVWQIYLKEGDASIKIGIRGRRKGEKRVLTLEQVKTTNCIMDQGVYSFTYQAAIWL